MNAETYKQQIINEVIVDKINSIELEERLNNLIMLAQNERAMEINNAMFPDCIGTAITEPTEIAPFNQI